MAAEEVDSVFVHGEDGELHGAAQAAHGVGD
jgi:hypothetical protein